MQSVRKLQNKSSDELQQLGINGYLYAKEHFDRIKLETKYIMKFI